MHNCNLPKVLLTIFCIIFMCTTIVLREICLTLWKRYFIHLTICKQYHLTNNNLKWQQYFSALEPRADVLVYCEQALTVFVPNSKLQCVVGKRGKDCIATYETFIIKPEVGFNILICLNHHHPSTACLRPLLDETFPTAYNGRVFHNLHVWQADWWPQQVISTYSDRCFCSIP